MSCASPLEHGEAVRVLHATCRFAGRPLPANVDEAVDVLVAIAGALPASRRARAEACLLVAAEFRADQAWADFDARR